MLTKTVIEEIDVRLRSGETLDAIATSRDMTVQKLRYALMMSGKKLAVTRQLVDCVPAASSEPAAEMVA